MSSSVGRYYDDMDDYNHLIETLQIKSRDRFYNHEDEIFEKFEVKNSREFWSKFKKLEEEGWNLDHIKDFYNIK